MTWPRRAATAAAILTAATLVTGIVLAVLAPSFTTLATLAVGLAVAPMAGVLGMVTARRPSAGPVGVLLALVGLSVAVTVTREVAWHYVAGQPGLADSLSWLVAVTAEGAWWMIAFVALLLLHFPDGRLPSPRWRWVPPVLVGAVVVVQSYGAFEPIPFRPPFENLARPFPAPPLWLDVLALVAFLAMLLLIVASVASLVVRHRRSDSLRRKQIKWLALGGLGVTAYPLLCLVEIILVGRPVWVSAVVGVVGLVGIPFSAAVAIVRHDLYDVDKAIAGTVTWGLVTVVLVGVYAASSLTAGIVLGQDSPLAAAGATAICALALSPLRGRLQRLVDGRFYPLRRSALTALDLLHTETSAGRSTPEQLEPVLRTALRDPGLRVGYSVPGRDGYVDALGAPVDGTAGEPVSLGGTAIGVLVPAGGEASVELLRQVGTRAATLVEMVRLRLELTGALRDVESSRARLLQIGYDERRRLERDLHDGAQQRLVSLGMSMRLAQRHLDDGTVDVDGLLDECVAELGTAVAELRQIAHGIRPSSLDDGLQAALARLVRNVPLVVEMEVDAGVLPDEVATTAYFVVSEALANAVKHAEASRIGLHVSRVNGLVRVRVSDDGRGGAQLHPDSGLADRVAALGGSLEVASPPGQGTVVEAALPGAS